MPFTPNLNWNKPDVNGDSDTWGGELNATLDAIDAEVFAIKQGVESERTITLTGALTSTATPLSNTGNTNITASLSAATQTVLDNKISKTGDVFGDLRKSAGGSVLYHTDTGLTAGGIIVSTNAPSGTPANGTIWIQW